MQKITIFKLRICLSI